MSTPTTYWLLVQSVEGIAWKPGPLRRKTPNLYVALYKDSVEVYRTRGRRDLTPEWGDLAKITADSKSSSICLRLFHDSAFPGGAVCLGAVEVTVAELLETCSAGANEKFAKLELSSSDGVSKRKPSGTLSVRLMKEVDAAASALERVHSNIGKMNIGPAASALMATGEKLENAGSVVENLQATLSTINAKLEVLVHLGDQIATIHPYANVAWKILTAVYQAAKQQQEADEKLLKLVETMADVYSFVEDTEFLAQRIKSVQDKTLAIVKQTAECAWFIQEYTANGFCGRAVRNTWRHMDTKIDELSAVLLKLKAAFESRLTVQSLFLSTKIFKKIEGLEQSDALRKLNATDMNATSRALCLPGTRREILDQITEWLSIPSDSGNVLWLSGVAGSGKSTVSTTVSESFRALERLGAFLFFDRNDPTSSHPDGVIRTLAYSLAQSNHHIASAISAAIQRDPAVVSAPIRTQFKALLLDPLTAIESSIQGPIVVIFDALDECGDPPSRAALLSVLSDELPKLPQLFRFLVTSRAEKDISNQFQSRFARKQLDVSSATGDIGVFIRHEMDCIKKAEDLDPAWPGEPNIRRLVDLSGGLFIWASTAAKFMGEYDPDARLRILLAGNFNLDHLYAVALRNSGPWDSIPFAQDARAILACVVLGRMPMTDRTIDMLLGQRSARVLKHLGSVVQWSPGAEARTLHASFADYLTDPDRSAKEPWSIDAKVQNCSLALGCLRILNSELRFNFCGLEDSCCLNANVPGISNRVFARLSQQLLYSSLFWFAHLGEAQFNEIALRQLRLFLENRLLYWLEVLSLLGQVSVASAALRVAARYIKDYDRDLKYFIADARKFVSAFAPVIAQSAPHIYLSALAFSPPYSRVVKQYGGWFPRRLRFQGSIGTHWPGLQAQFHAHDGSVRSVCFSPDGTWIVSGSSDSSLCIWDAETGMLATEPLMGHMGMIHSVQFSPDGSQIVSGSEDHTIRIWNSRTGAVAFGPLTGHTDEVYSVNFSPDGVLVASGSGDTTVRIWTAQTGELITVCEGHTEAVLSVQFSPHGEYIVSGSIDYTVRVWSVQTGEMVAGPFQNPSIVTFVRFTLDGQIISGGHLEHGVQMWMPQRAIPVRLVGQDSEGDFDRIQSVHLSPYGTRTVSGTENKTVYLWDNNGDCVGGPWPHNAKVMSVTFSPDGARIASGSSDGSIHIWDAQSGCDVLLTWAKARANFLEFSPDGSRIACGTPDYGVVVRDPQTGAVIGGPFQGHTASITCVQFSPDGNTITSSSDDGTVRVWDAETASLVAILMDYERPILSFVLSTSTVDGITTDTVGKITTAENDGLAVWDLLTDQQYPAPVEIGVRQNLELSRDGTHVATTSWDGTVRVWSSETSAHVFGPNRSFKGTLHIRDNDNGSIDPRLGYANGIRCVKFSPDSTLLAAGFSDGSLCVWDADSGRLVAGPLEGHTDEILTACFSLGGAFLASSSRDDTIRFWNIQPGAMAPGLVSPQNEITSSPQNPLGDYPTFDLRTGWVSNSGKLIFWVPPWLRDGLYLPRNTLVIRERGTTQLDLTDFVHGLEWQSCINPKFRNGQ